jgi:hypothetical protein
MKRLFVRAFALLALAWIAFVGWIYASMTAPPEIFTRRIAKLPMPAMMLFPFETMWSSARAGKLSPGDAAPDFALKSVDGSTTATLAEHRGVRPVVLIFGSYT